MRGSGWCGAATRRWRADTRAVHATSDACRAATFTVRSFTSRVQRSTFAVRGALPTSDALVRTVRLSLLPVGTSRDACRTWTWAVRAARCAVRLRVRAVRLRVRAVRPRGRGAGCNAPVRDRGAGATHGRVLRAGLRLRGFFRDEPPYPNPRHPPLCQGFGGLKVYHLQPLCGRRWESKGDGAQAERREVPRRARQSCPQTQLL